MKKLIIFSCSLLVVIFVAHLHHRPSAGYESYLESGLYHWAVCKFHTISENYVRTEDVTINQV